MECVRPWPTLIRCVPQLTSADADVIFVPSSQTWPDFAGLSRRTVPELLLSGVVAMAGDFAVAGAVAVAGEVVAGEDACVVVTAAGAEACEALDGSSLA